MASRKLSPNEDPICVFLFTMVVLLGLAYGGQFAGPFEGWLDRLGDSARRSGQEARQPPQSLSEAPTGIEDALRQSPVALPEAQENGGLALPEEGTRAAAADGARPPTPEHLRPALSQFAKWLEVQQRRQGKLVARVSAQQRGGRVALYLTVEPVFQQLDADTREQLVDSLWRNWALRCRQHGVVTSERSAEIVVEDGDQRELAIGRHKSRGGVTLK